MSETKLKAEKREIYGRRVKDLRFRGLVPGNVYGTDIKSFGVQMDKSELKASFEEAGETGIVNVLIGKESIPVLIQNIQSDPVTGEYIHVDFRQVNLKEKITAMVPIELVGESVVVKRGEGILTQLMDEIEVVALPANFPDSVDVDVSVLDAVDKSISVGDLKYDKSKLEITTDPKIIVARIASMSKQEEEVVSATPEAVEEVQEREEGKQKEEEG